MNVSIYATFPAWICHAVGTEKSKFSSFCLLSALEGETTCSCLDPEPENYNGQWTVKQTKNLNHNKQLDSESCLF